MICQPIALFRRQGSRRILKLLKMSHLMESCSLITTSLIPPKCLSAHSPSAPILSAHSPSVPILR